MAESLREKSVRGVTWSAIERFSLIGVQFVIQLVHARLLTPTDYGIVGMVYGVLYCSKEPLATTDLQQKLQFSRGACVEATQLLSCFGAVRTVVKIGERKDFFETETDLKKIATGALYEILLPGIDKVSQRLEHAEKLSRGKTAKAKIAQLKRARDAVSALAPMVENFLKN